MELYSLSFVLLVTVGLLLYYTVLRTRQWLCLLGLSLVFCSQRLAGLYVLLFTALTVWGGGLCLAKLDTDAAARRKQPGLPKEEKKAIKAQTTRRKRACWPVSWL